MLPLPNELTIEQNIALLEDCVKELVKLGMIVDANIHYDNENNKHAHLMCSMRELVENRYGEIEFSPTKNRAWNHKNFVNFTYSFLKRVPGIEKQNSIEESNQEQNRKTKEVENG